MKQKTHVSEIKLARVKDLSKEIAQKNTFLVASIKGLPSKQFQIIKRLLAKQGVDVRVLRKRIILRSIDNSKKEKLTEIKKFVKEDVAVLISDMDAFELASKLESNKSPVKAKIGQISPEDVEVEAGTTDLPAGPAVSELSGIGLVVKVSGGKIEIMEKRVIVKKGQAINEKTAGVMGKLGIMPFTVGYIPIAAYDAKSGMIYETLTINKQELLENLRNSYAKANSFSVNIGYYCKENIGMILLKASSHEKALSSRINIQQEPKPEENK